MDKTCCQHCVDTSRAEAFRHASTYLRGSLHNSKYLGTPFAAAIHAIADDIKRLGDNIVSIYLPDAIHEAYDIVSHGAGGDSAP